MFEAVRWVGLAAGAVAAVVVYADASRRGLARPRSLAAVFGVLAAAGFVAPSVLYELAYRGGRPDAIARAPRTLFAGMLLTGLFFAAGSVLVYGLASRLRR